MQTGPWLIAILIAAYPVKTPAQELGGVSLRLGESQGGVMRKLARYQVQHATGTSYAKDFWWVSDTTKWVNGPNLGNVGFVQFRNDRLIAVSREWLYTRGEGDAMRVTINALRQLDRTKGESQI